MPKATRTGLQASTSQGKANAARSRTQKIGQSRPPGGLTTKPMGGSVGAHSNGPPTFNPGRTSHLSPGKMKAGR